MIAKRKMKEDTKEAVWFTVRRQNFNEKSIKISSKKKNQLEIHSKIDEGLLTKLYIHYCSPQLLNQSDWWQVIRVSENGMKPHTAGYYLQEISPHLGRCKACHPIPGTWWDLTKRLLATCGRTSICFSSLSRCCPQKFQVVMTISRLPHLSTNNG